VAREVLVQGSETLDACPGILTLHPARDGHVARIRLPGGYVSRPQWTALAALAADFGDGCLDLTARGNVQLRGLSPTAAAEFGRRAARAGLLPSGAHDRSRNITASPLSGKGGRPPLRRLVSALDAALIADQELAALPGRFLCAVDDGTGGAALADSDLGLRRAGRRVEVTVAGRSAGVSVPVSAAVPAVLTAAREAIARGVGRGVTGIRDLADGGASVAAAIGGSLGPPASPDDGRLPLGMSTRDRGTLGMDPDAAASNGAASDRPAPNPTCARDTAFVPEPAFVHNPVSAPDPVSARDSAVAVIAAPLGRLTGAQIVLIGALLRSGEVIRLAPAGRVVIPLAAPWPAGPADQAIGPANHAAGPANPVLAPDSLARLAAAGLLTSDDDALAGVTACSGLACNRAVADVRAAARPLPGHPRTHWAACPRSCGKPRDAEAVIAAGPGSFLLPGQPAPRPLADLVDLAAPAHLTAPNPPSGTS
jgi:precorrin-3B synthase